MTNSVSDLSFGEVAETILDMCRNGEGFVLRNAIEAFPHLENEIREKLPALLLLEDAFGPTDFDVDTIVCGCEVIEEVGRGAFGVVYRGFQPDLSRSVAIKIVKLRIGDEKQASRFEFERRALAKLDHPNIVPPYAFSQVDGYACLVMKFIDGYTFDQMLNEKCDYQGRKLLAERRTDWKLFAKMASDVASALEHAHDQGLIHRDIKPSNLMLDNRGHAWVTDFGLVKVFDDDDSLTATGDVLGTPRYMAPEQMRGICDARSDIYALGLTLFEASSGRPANESEARDSNEFPKRLEFGEQHNLPAPLVDIIQKACAYSPDDRYQTARELRIVLERFIGDQVPDRRKGRRKPDDVFRQESKSKLLRYLASAFAGSVVAGLAYFNWPTQPEELPVQPSVNLVERLADNPDTDLSDVMRDIAINSAIESSAQLGLTSREKKELITGIDKLAKGLKSGELSPHSMKGVLDNYRKSRLAHGTKIMRVAEFVSKANLSPADEAAAKKTIRKFAFLASKGKIPSDEVDELLNSLTEGKPLTYDKLSETAIDAKHLSEWISRINSKIGHLDAPAPEMSTLIRDVFSDLENDAWPHLDEDLRKKLMQRFMDEER